MNSWVIPPSSARVREAHPGGFGGLGRAAGPALLAASDRLVPTALGRESGHRQTRCWPPCDRMIIGLPSESGSFMWRFIR